MPLPSAAIDPLRLRSAFGCYATGVVVVTARAIDGSAAGMTINSFSSLSLDPPLLLWSIARDSRNHDSYRAAAHFGIHVLHEGQQALARQFSSRGAERFAGVALVNGPGKLPLLADYHVRFECETVDRHDGGDHTIIVGRVLAFDERIARPLIFHRGRFGAVG